jgi:hypothetical protein
VAENQLMAEKACLPGSGSRSGRLRWAAWHSPSFPVLLIALFTSLCTFAAPPSSRIQSSPQSIQGCTQQGHEESEAIGTASAPTPDDFRKGAEGPNARCPAAPGRWWANRGRWTLGFQAGYAVQNTIPRNISHINLLLAEPQIGVIAKDAPCTQFPVHRFEIMSEGFFGYAIHPGGRVTGGTLVFRLDGRPHGRLIPFFDVGGGMLNTTLNAKAPELSGSFQFNAQGGPGVQYLVSPQRAVVIQYRWLHLSNANTQPPNISVNGNMITVGFRWLRRPPQTGKPGNLRSRSRNPLRRLFGAP